MTEQEFLGSLIEGETGCLEFLGYRNRLGYGYIWFNLRYQLTHRVSWQIHKGSIPVDMCVLHTCDNPPCCNPEHLFLGTRQDNSDDMIKKGREYHPERFGEMSPNVRLRTIDVIEIKKLLRAGQKETVIASKFNISRGAINQISLGYTWRHVE